MNKKIIALIFINSFISSYATKQTEFLIPYAENDFVLLSDINGTRHPIKKNAGLHADLIKSMLEEEAYKDEAIPLPNISPSAMQRLITRLTLLDEDNGKEIIKSCLYNDITPEKLYEDAQAADYVAAEELFQLTVRALTDTLIQYDPSVEGMLHQICAFDNPHIKSLIAKEFVNYLKSNTPWHIQNRSRAHVLSINSIAVSPDQTLLATGSADGRAGFWDTKTFTFRENPLKVDRYGINAVAFSPDNTQLVTTSTGEGTALVWDLSSQQPIAQLVTPDIINCVAFSPDGTQILTGLGDGSVLIWDKNSPATPIGALPGHHTQGVTSLAFSPDTTKIITGSDDRTIIIVDWNSLQPIGEPLDNTSGVNALAFSHNGTQIVAGLANGAALIWDVHTHQRIGKPLVGHKRDITSLAFSPDDTKIVTGSRDKTVRLWDAHTHEQIGSPLETPTDPLPITSVIFYSEPTKIMGNQVNNTKIIAGDTRGTLYIWHQQAVEDFLNKWEAASERGC